MKFIKKYFEILIVVILIQLVINYFTNTVSLNDIWNKGWMVLFILIFLILIPFVLNFIDSQKLINETDRSVFTKLMINLHESDIDYILRVMTNNIPISIYVMKPIWNFLDDYNKAIYKIHNKKLNELLYKFQYSLRCYSQKRGLYTSPLDNIDEMYFGFDSYFKNTEHELYDKRVKELDHLASIAHKYYTNLIEFAKSKDLDLSYIIKKEKD